MERSIAIVDILGRWVDEHKLGSADLTCFAVNLDCDTVEMAYRHDGLDGLAVTADLLSAAVEAWCAASQPEALRLGVSIGWHSISGAALAPPTPILRVLPQLVQEVVQRLPNSIYVACGICQISNRTGFRISEGSEREFGSLIGLAGFALAAAMRHTKKKSVLFNVNPDSFWASRASWNEL